ncbi:MAG: hypothetical protein N2595_09970 [bacterium]|nr:hypothetical protein [bacterium]
MRAKVIWVVRVASVVAMGIVGGCATLTYEAEEWRVAVPAEGDAQAVVRYIGLATRSEDPATREALAGRIEELAKETAPGSAFGPLRAVSTRKVYMEGNKIVLEETGTLRNPFNWFNQSGLNPATWWSPAPELVQKKEFIVMRDIESPRRVIATDGRVVDEDTYTRILKSRLPIEISTDTKWQRQEDRPTEEDVQAEQAQVILWPRNARTFYWKISGPAFGKPGQLLSREYVVRVKPKVEKAAPVEEVAGAPAPEPKATVTPLREEEKEVPESAPRPEVKAAPPVSRPEPAAPADAGIVPVGGVEPLEEAPIK